MRKRGKVNHAHERIEMNGHESNYNVINFSRFFKNKFHSDHLINLRVRLSTRLILNWR